MAFFLAFHKTSQFGTSTALTTVLLLDREGEREQASMRERSCKKVCCFEFVSRMRAVCKRINGWSGK